ncbi:hypothetical protein OH77DRAFT_1161183 [Trametes cingulata]|nr:hypothetical protein OH77DRAFT_1161183 [Trametes cingulata]
MPLVVDATLHEAIQDWTHDSPVNVTLHDIRDVDDIAPLRVFSQYLQQSCHLSGHDGLKESSDKALNTGLNILTSGAGNPDGNAEPSQCQQHPSQGHRLQGIHEMMQSAFAFKPHWTALHPNEPFPWIPLFTSILRECLSDEVVVRRDCPYIKPCKGGHPPDMSQDTIGLVSLLVLRPHPVGGPIDGSYSDTPDSRDEVLYVKRYANATISESHHAWMSLPLPVKRCGSGSSYSAHTASTTGSDDTSTWEESDDSEDLISPPTMRWGKTAMLPLKMISAYPVTTEAAPRTRH